MNPTRWYSVLIISSCFLLAFFTYQNREKPLVSRDMFSRIVHGKSLQRLEVQDGKGEALAHFSLPTSDLFDRTGERKINLFYLDKEAFNALSSRLNHSQFVLNGKKVEDVEVIHLHENAVSIALPKKKLYILAPPHMAMAIRALKFERKNRKDVFSCKASKAFCNSIRVEGFGGISTIIEQTLIEDTLFGEEPFPRGRWVSEVLGLSLTSMKKQRVNVRYTLKTPMVKQAVRVKRPVGAHLQMLRHGELGGLKTPGISLADFIFDLQVELEEGDNVIELVFDIVTEKSLDVPMEMSGILTTLEVMPAQE